MSQPQNKSLAQSTEANLRLRQLHACEGIEIDFTDTDIWITDTKSDLNIRKVAADLEWYGIAAEVKNFYCG